MGANILSINDYLDDNTLQEIEYNLLEFAKTWQQQGSDSDVLEQSMRADIDAQIGYDDDEAPAAEHEEPASYEEAMDNIYQFRNSTKGTKKEKTPITPQSLRDAFGVVTGGLTNKSASFERAERDAMSYKTDWAEQEMNITAGHARIGNKDMDYRLVRNPVGWGNELSDDPSKTFDNLNFIKNKLSVDVYNQFGGWSRISEIAIVDSQLIINKIMYVPLIEPRYINRLPLDVADYIGNGCVAPLFDWKFLKKMNNLVTFICDDATFYVTNIADDIGLSRRIGVCSLFNICGKLDYLRIGSEEITRDNLYQSDSVGIKKSVEKQNRFLNMTDGFSLNIYDHTKNWQASSINSLKHYATHRGNKGGLRYGVGMAFNIGKTAGAVGINLLAHAIGGIYNSVKEVVNDCRSIPTE